MAPSLASPKENSAALEMALGRRTRTEIGPLVTYSSSCGSSRRLSCPSYRRPRCCSWPGQFCLTESPLDTWLVGQPCWDILASLRSPSPSPRTRRSPPRPRSRCCSSLTSFEQGGPEKGLFRLPRFFPGNECCFKALKPQI